MSDTTAEQGAGPRLTWPKMAALAAALAVGIAGGVGYLAQLLLASYDARLSQLHADASAGFDTAGQADRDIRQYIESTNQLLRAEFTALRQEVGQLGNRVVEANVEVGRQVGQLRLDLVGVIEKRDAQLEGRFDRLEQRMDELLKRITFEAPIELNRGEFRVDADGKIWRLSA